MQLIKEIKNAQLEARKNKDKLSSSVLTALISEITAVGKNNGNRETTDDEAIKIITKFKKGCDENKRILKNRLNSEDKILEIENEVKIYDRFLPKLMSERETEMAVNSILLEMAHPNMGQVMGALKKEYGSSLDMSIASRIVKKIIN